MSEEEINKAILTLDVLIDCTKEDGTYYNAKKEWEALEVFKKLQQENQQLKEELKNASNNYTKYIQERDTRINKAIEFMEEYNEVVIPEANIKSLILKEEYKKIINLLKGDKE